MLSDSQNLLALLGAVPNVNTHLTIHAAKTLGDLTASLRSRLRYYQDPSLFTTKQGKTTEHKCFLLLIYLLLIHVYSLVHMSHKTPPIT